MNPPDEVPESTVNGQTRTVESVTRAASKPRRKDKGQAHHMFFTNPEKDNLFFMKLYALFYLLEGCKVSFSVRMNKYIGIF